MISAESIIGRVVIFICEKAGAQIIKLPLDKRKRACRALTRLYYSLQTLDEATESILNTTNDFRTTRSGEAFAIMNALNNHMREIELAANQFFDLGQELRSGLAIIDPVLAQCCEALYVSKFDFLSEMSDCVVWDRSLGKSRVIVKMPRRSVDTAVLEQSYAATLEAFQAGAEAYWPEPWISSDEPAEIILTWEDHSAAHGFIERLSQHHAVLIEAKERLRQLLKASFSVEELLFQSDTRPQNHP